MVISGFGAGFSTDSIYPAPKCFDGRAGPPLGLRV
jgi:hypothetical protein